jgi:rod shape determining protein RodA
MMATRYMLPFSGKIIVFVSACMIVFSIIVLSSIAPFLFPSYFLYVAVALVLFIIFYSIDFEILELFSAHLYIVSIVLLCLPIVFGEVTRGAIRWIEIGGITFQPSEIVRPFLFLFIARELARPGKLTLKRIIYTSFYCVIPLLLIFFQPSFGVSMITGLGFGSIFVLKGIPKRTFLYIVGGLLAIIPLLWFVLAPYQRARIIGFINPWADPYGSGYNSIQSMISVASGEVTGRGLGKGIQTQLSFLPERHTDFIFAAIGEELGFVGTFATLLLISAFLWFLSNAISDAKTLTQRCFIAGVTAALLGQISVHIGMNIGILPVTGLPLPLLSAGGSAMIGTLISLGIVISALKAR